MLGAVERDVDLTVEDLSLSPVLHCCDASTMGIMKPVIPTSQGHGNEEW